MIVGDFTPTWNLIAGPLTGALIAAMVAWMTNLGHDKREERRLEHDAAQKDLDRKLALKREIYLSAIADVGRLEFAITKIFNFKVEDIESELPLEALELAFRKVATVAPLSLYKEALITGQLVRTELQPLIVERGMIKDESNSFYGVAADCQEAQRSGREAAVSEVDFNKMKQNLVFRHLDFCRRCMAAYLTVKRGVLPLIREMRREFDTSINMKEFEALLEDDYKHSETTLRANLEKLLPST